MAKITKVPNGPLIKKKGPFKGSTLKSGGVIKKAQNGSFNIGGKEMTTTRAKNDTIPQPNKMIWVNNPMPGKRSGNVTTPKGITKKKAGGMIKRADGSMSKRGLWDNIRANKGSGKKPTKQMLVQEKKIKAKTKK